MKNKKILFISLVLGLIVSLILVSSVYAVSTAIGCCEKTNSGAWCQNTQEENCDPDLRFTPTSCAGTSFCKPGCCFDSQEGLCMERTPQKVCNDANGTWADEAECNIPQCSAGCCIIGDQASFATLTRCKRLSSVFGLSVNFRTDINNELDCIETAFAQEKGACVFESGFEVTCRMTTRGDCLGASISGNVSSKPKFYRNSLCSNEELGTVCGLSKKTMCVDGKDEVYFQDTCGNIANVYDASRVKDKSYWKEIIPKSSSCGAGEDNAGSRDCGNCDYFIGSICAKGNARYGELACRDLSCDVEINGRRVTKQNGESWCAYDGAHGNAADLVGSRQYRHICISGEELVEPCDDFRAKVCIESESPAGNFIEAACRPNRWKDCFVQQDEDDCLNTDARDCTWIDKVKFTHDPLERQTITPEALENINDPFQGGIGSVPGTGTVVAPITGKAIFGDDDEKESNEESSGVQLTDGDDVEDGVGSCVPDTPPGLEFWKTSGSSNVCALGNSVCIVETEKKLFQDDDDAEEKKNKECLEESYAQTMNDFCTSLGDCGAYVNIAGKTTYSAAEWRIDEEKQVMSGILGDVKRSGR